MISVTPEVVGPQRVDVKVDEVHGALPVRAGQIVPAPPVTAVDTDRVSRPLVPSSLGDCRRKEAGHVDGGPVVTTMVIGKGPDQRMGRKADENDVGGHQEGQRCGTVHEVDVHRLVAGA